MSEPKVYVQCRLRDGARVTTGWIEQRGARLGATVQMLPSGELWVVDNVFRGITLTETQLKAMQSAHRASLPSVERIDA